jgi:hypothetical protein
MDLQDLKLIIPKNILYNYLPGFLIDETKVNFTNIRTDELFNTHTLPVFSPVLIIRRLNELLHYQVNTLLLNNNNKGNTLIDVYVNCITTSDKLPLHVKEVLKQNNIFLLLLILFSPVDTSFHLIEYLKERFPPCNNNSNNYDYPYIEQFTLQLQKYLYHIVQQDDLTRRGLGKDILILYKTLYNENNNYINNKVKGLMKQIKPIPFYISKRDRYFILLLTYLNNGSTYFNYLFTTTFPRVRLIGNMLFTDKSKQKKIPYVIWKEILCYFQGETRLYKKLQMREMTFLKEFEEYIWLTHLFTPDSIIKKVQFDKNEIISVKKPIKETKYDVFLQAICLQFDNWKEIWLKMNWNSSWEVQKRLYFLKNEQEWEIPEKQLVFLLFG